MKDPSNSRSAISSRSPWNKGKLIGPKPPLKRKNVWTIRSRLELDGRMRDLALFNLAIDSLASVAAILSACVSTTWRPEAMPLIARSFGKRKPACR